MVSETDVIGSEIISRYSFIRVDRKTGSWNTREEIENKKIIKKSQKYKTKAGTDSS